MNFLYIVGCIGFTVLGQILIKKGVWGLRGEGSILLYATNVYIVAGLLSAVVAALSWIKALQVYDLSYAYPFMSLSFILVALFSVIVFGEAVKVNQWIGLIVVLAGLYVASR
ncbi:EamA family transporter [Thermodesulfobacteriota bacterium]